MVSFLIPTYNYDITELVLKIISSAKKAKVEYEIIAVDDASNIERLHRINMFLGDMDGVSYEILKENIGRSKIRNYLANKSNGEWLCFLDCDCIPKDEDFLCRYLEKKDCADVVCGGTEYKTDENKTLEREYALHFRFGKKREEGKHHFTTNNFFIKKEIFSKECFDESLKGYGHEDTIFGKSLECSGYKIIYIDNPVYHLGLKTTEHFLKDTANAQVNLRLLYETQKYHAMLKDVKIIKTYEKTKALHLNKALEYFYKATQKLTQVALYSANPPLHLLDLYKLYYFSTAYSTILPSSQDITLAGKSLMTK